MDRRSTEAPIPGAYRRLTALRNRNPPTQTLRPRSSPRCSTGGGGVAELLAERRHGRHDRALLGVERAERAELERRRSSCRRP
jgi:hypothetical protein